LGSKISNLTSETRGINAVSRRCTLPLLLCLSLVSVLVLGAVAHADDISRAPVGKSLQTGPSLDTTYQLKLGSTLDRMLSETSTSDIHDPLTISSLKRLKEQALPSWNPNDIDPERTRGVAERALAIQTGRTINELLMNSELRSTYQAVRRAFTDLQDTFRYSVQQGDKGFKVSQGPKKSKLIEFNLEVNPKEGLDPQLRIGEHTRFRYDLSSQAPMLEYGFNF